jgi:hypothetical protein
MRLIRVRFRWSGAAIPVGPAPLVLLALLAATQTPAMAAPTGRVKPAQRLVRVLQAHAAFSKPDRHSTSVELVRARRPITGERTVLPVIGHKRGRGGVAWLQVRLPGRPNGHTGWIVKRGTAAALTSWHIVVRTSSRHVSVYRWSRLVRVFKAIVGKPSTPTPRGEFFVEESVLMPAGAVGAPFALALSARSRVLQEFAGGPGQVAIHGLENIGGVLGTAVSHGCVRVSNGASRWLSRRIGPGVPVTITS